MFQGGRRSSWELFFPALGAAQSGVQRENAKPGTDADAKGCTTRRHRPGGVRVRVRVSVGACVRMRAEVPIVYENGKGRFCGYSEPQRLAPRE